MKTAFVLLTDERGYDLTLHAVAAAMITQKSTRNYVIFCHGFEASRNDDILIYAKQNGLNLETRAALPQLDLTAFSNPNAASHISSTTTLKMDVIDSICSEFDRILYLDGDILLMEDINLELIDFGGAPIAAVYDIADASGISDPDFYRRCSAYDVSPHYFNAGFIAVDFCKWNKEYLLRYHNEIRRHASDCYYKSKCWGRDQCAWNFVFQKSWKRLPLSFNFQGCGMFSPSWTYASVRHYLGSRKFIPFRGWRNDKKDMVLINKARRILGLSQMRIGWSSALRSLNVIRHRKQTQNIYFAINRLEKMFSEPM